MIPIPLVHRFSFKVISGLISMLFLVGIPFFFLFLRYHRNQLLETMETSTTNMSRILAHQLEVSVLEGRHHDLERVVKRLSAGGDARKIMIINSSGKVAVSSDTSQLGLTLQRNTEPGCRECHSGMVLKDTIYLSDSEGRSYYRNVNVIQNKPPCYSCHDSGSSVNGILVMDFSQDNLQSQFRSSLIRLLGMGAAMLLLTIAVLYVLLDHLVLRRLRRFAEAADQIGQTHFGRVEMPGNDEFSQLASGFNVMSNRLASAMKEIQGSKEYLESIINNIDDEIVVLDRDAKVVTANAAYYRNRQALRRLIPEDDCAQWDVADGAGEGAHEPCASTMTFRDGQVHKVLRSFIDANGKERFVEAFSCPLRNEAGEVYQVIEVRRDITERRMLEANLAHSERLASMGLLASGLAHEINNPLASISTFVEGLKRRWERRKDSPAGGMTGLEQSLGLILKEIERAKDVTQRLLILSQKDESGRSLVNLNESLMETVSLVRYEASKREIDIEVEIDPTMPTIKKSESQIRQIFLNLLLNSLQAGHPGGHVQCRTWHEDGRAFACVEDDGIGIEAGDLMKIFEPFFSKKPVGQGTGLGLFICKSIVSSLGGAITAESTAGRGAKFTVWFPVEL